MKDSGKTVGLTKDSGWQFGLRKTFDLSSKEVWDFMFSNEGLDIWLGKMKTELAIDKPFQTKVGIEGVVKVLKPYSHIRMSWKKKEWEHDSALQVRITEKGKKTTIAFHHDKLANAEQREEVSAYWNSKMESIESSLSER